MNRRGFLSAPWRLAYRHFCWSRVCRTSGSNAMSLSSAPGRRGILGAYLSGRIAGTISGLDEASSGRFVLERMERLHPGVTEHFEVSASYSGSTIPGRAAPVRGCRSFAVAWLQPSW